ncbi:MAG TPA: glycosyltransferase [Gaiellaceae bacterium]|nr:glycosyltransferase [Gaiellaceae bacterium]
MNSTTAGDPSKFQPFDEAVRGVPESLRNSLFFRVATRAVQFSCIVYAAFLIYWVWLAKDFTTVLLLHDPVFYTYSILVTGYVCLRFLLAPLYRPTPDVGYRPQVSIVIPAFNEEGAIEQTIEAILASLYPPEKLDVVVVDDGSTDSTWDRMLAAQERNPSVVCVRFDKNRGKRAAMAEGIRRATAEICAFVDSDSVLEPDALARIVADFGDPRVGAVVGHADVLNKTSNWLTRMQQVRYYVAFRVIKGSESLFGAVTCASGCFSAYRRDALLAILDKFENQHFLGRQSTFGDDRALTNYVLRNWRVMYQSRAISHTIVPEHLRQFGRQQLRWKKSWLRESIHVSRFIWRKHPLAAAMTYAGVLFPWVAPAVLVHSLYFRALGNGSPLFYLMGAYVMAVLYSLYYAVVRKSPLWWHGVTFVAIYMAFLVWQTYYALLTIRNTSWGTRASTHGGGGGVVTVVGPAVLPPEPLL